MIYNGLNTGIRVHVNDDVKTDNRLSTYSRPVTSGHVVIGRRYVTVDEKYCSVMVDELMLFNKSLTSQEVEHLMSLY